MNLVKINSIQYDNDENFPHYCRLRTIEEGCILIKNFDNNNLVKFLNSFGEIVPQHDGNDTFDVKPSEELAKIYYSRTMDSVPPHTDGHDMQTPPHFFFLYCITPSESNDGFTEISSSTDLLKTLTQNEFEKLCTHEFSFITKPSAKIMNAPEVRAPIYNKNTNIFRYSYNYLSKQSKDKYINEIIEKIKKFHEKNKLPIILGENDLLICENHHILHSRGSFSGNKRHLIRAWVN